MGQRGQWLLVCISPWPHPTTGDPTILTDHEANGGPTGVLYELLVACFYYAFIGASIAEVGASSAPPSVQSGHD